MVTSRAAPDHDRWPPRTLLGFAAAVGVFGVVGTGCPRAAAPAGPGLAASGWTLGADRLGTGAIVAIAPAGPDIIVATAEAVRRIGIDGAVAWSRAVPAAPSVVAVGGGLIAVAIEGETDAAALAAAGIVGLPDGLRGAPGAAVIALGDDGAPRWTVGVGATRWAMVRALAVDGDEVVVGGTFAGTLRIGDKVVTAAGSADGFWARLDGQGALITLARIGGDGFDAVTGVAALTDGRIAVGGTFTGTAELAGTELESPKGDQVGGDGFVAVHDRAGALAWARTWGGELEDTCAGVAALAGGEVAIAGTVTGEIEVAGRRLTTAGISDGLVAVLGADGAVRGAALLGGPDVDSITALAASGTHAVVAGRFSGTIATRHGAVSAPSADAAFVAAVDREGVLGLAPIASAAATIEARLAADDRGWVLAAHADLPLALGADAQPAGSALWRRPW